MNGNNRINSIKDWIEKADATAVWHSDWDTDCQAFIKSEIKRLGKHYFDPDFQLETEFINELNCLNTAILSFTIRKYPNELLKIDRDFFQQTKCLKLSRLEWMFLYHAEELLNCLKEEPDNEPESILKFSNTWTVMRYVVAGHIFSRRSFDFLFMKIVYLADKDWSENDEWIADQIRKLCRTVLNSSTLTKDEKLDLAECILYKFHLPASMLNTFRDRFPMLKRMINRQKAEQPIYSKTPIYRKERRA